MCKPVYRAELGVMSLPEQGFGSGMSELSSCMCVCMHPGVLFRHLEGSTVSAVILALLVSRSEERRVGKEC